MGLAGIEQRLDAQRAVRRCPFAAEIVWIGFVHEAVVGVDDAPGRGIDAARQPVEGDEAQPLGLGGHIEAAVPERHPAGRDDADAAGPVRIDDVLLRRVEAAQRRNEVRPVPRLVQTPERLGRQVVIAECRALDRPAFGQRIREIRDDDAVAGSAQFQVHAVAPSHHQRLAPDRDDLRVRNHIGGVGVRSGQSPGDAAVMAQHHEGNARRGRARQRAFRRLDARQVPDVRDRETQMRIVGECGRFAHGPDIRGAAAA